MTKRYDALLAAPLLVVFLIAGWWFADEDTAEAPTPDAVAPEASRSGREVVRARQATRAPVQDEAPTPESAEVERAFDAMELPGASLLRCPTELADGLYEINGALMADVRFVTVADGELFAAAWADEGRAVLAQELQQVGWLSWSGADEGWASCTVEPPVRATVSGRVLFADDDTSGHTVTGCLFGEVVDVGEDGRFELAAHEGRGCTLYVIRADGDDFGKGPVLAVPVDGDVEGVEVPGPSRDELWDPQAQARFAEALAGMSDGRLLELAERERPELELDAPDLAPLLQAWADQDDDRQVAMADHVDALLDPEQQHQALLDAFLGLY